MLQPLLFILYGLGFGQLVAALVEFDADVAFDPVEGDVVGGVELVQFDPVSLVEDGLAVGFLPAPALPAGDPFGDAVLEVLAVCVQGDFRAFRCKAQGHDGCQELHAVVRRRRIAVA